MGPPLVLATKVDELLREVREAEEPVCRVEADNWLVRGAPVMVS